MYEHLKADAKIRISEELVDNFKEINARLAEACGLALRQPVLESFRASGYALMIEENDERKLLSKKNLRNSSVRITCLLTSQLKRCPYIEKKFWPYNMLLLKYSHIPWETTIPTLVLTTTGH